MNLFLRSALTISLSASLAFSDWNSISTVGEGHKIRVETNAKKYNGKFFGLSETGLKLRSRDGEVSLPRAEVARVYSQTDSHRVRNTIIGTVIGVAIGVTVYATLGALIRNESGEDTAALLLTPMAASAAIGAVLPTGKMVKIYDAQQDSVPSTSVRN